MIMFQKKKSLLLIFSFLLFSSSTVYCQNHSKKRILKKQEDTICKNKFLVQRIVHTKYYSDNIILPVTIVDDKYRLVIKSEYLHKYLTVMNAKNEKEMNLDSILLDSSMYVNKVLNIINKRERLVFNENSFAMFVKDGKYIILDKPNPYSKEIKQIGLDAFIEKRLFKLGQRQNNTFYRLIQKEEYGKHNEYKLDYLIEALFEYNFIYQIGDGDFGFVKIGCDSK